jgi:SiaC family regulatory phosphoprotein
MQKLHITSTRTTPEILFSPEDNIFFIHGISAPEDVRELYYPVIEWLKTFIDETIKMDSKIYTTENPFKFQSDLEYFNSSSAKFIYDIFSELKKLPPHGIPMVVEWFHDEEDEDMKEAGIDISLLAEMEFTYIPKKG